jgi:hypothetical protein
MAQPLEIVPGSALGSAPEIAPVVRAELPAARALGTGRLKFWGFDVYDVVLWAEPGFRHNDFANQPFALELSYLRSANAQDIARVSLEEIGRVVAVEPAKAAQWQAALAAAIPDVKRGDRVAGIHRPGVGVTFITNGRQTGEIRSAEFARLFFGIWLGPRTSEPALRKALIGTSPP